MNDPWLKFAFLILLAGGAGLGLVTLERGLDDSSRLTAARHLAWLDVADQPIESGDLETCRGDDTLRSLVWGDQLWTSCPPSSTWPAGSYVVYAPERGVVEAKWPLPDQLPLQRTEGLLPGPSQQLAIAYRSSAAGRLVVGIAGRRGWVRAPEAVDSTASVVLLGMSWSQSTLEIVTAESPSVDRPDGWNEPRVHTISASDAIRVRDVSRDALCLPDWLRCGVQAAVRQPGASVWRFLVSSREPPTLWVVVETGLRRSVRDFEYPWDARWDLDLTTTGLLIDLSLRLRATLTHEGEVMPLPRGAAAAFAGWVHDYEVRGDRIAMRRQFLLGETALMLDRDDGSTLGVEMVEGRPRKLIGYRSRDVQVSTENLLGVITSDCRDLIAGAFIDRPDGGVWLVSPGGCTMAIGPEIERADPLGLVEHLRTRGSTCLSCRDNHRIWAFIWIVVGLPVCLAIGYGYVAFRRWQQFGMVRVQVWPILILAVLAYGIPAIMAARLVLPFL